jgi:hypothetical protein
MYKDIKAGGDRDEIFDLGDIFIEPLTLSWHFQQFDLGIGYGIWAPTGNVETDSVTMGTGQGAWAHMVSGGGTLYFDKQKSWALSALGRYEINYKSSDWSIIPGDTLSIEGGIGKSLNPSLELGIQAHYQLQTTSDEAMTASWRIVRGQHAGGGTQPWFWEKPASSSRPATAEVLAEHACRATPTLTSRRSSRFVADSDRTPRRFAPPGFLFAAVSRD